MEYKELMEAFEDLLEQHIKPMKCPSCQAETTFMQVEYWPHGYVGDAEYYWRCMKCLKLFRRELIEVQGD